MVTKVPVTLFSTDDVDCEGGTIRLFSRKAKRPTHRIDLDRAKRVVDHAEGLETAVSRVQVGGTFPFGPFEIERLKRGRARVYVRMHRLGEVGTTRVLVQTPWIKAIAPKIRQILARLAPPAPSSTAS